MRPHGQRRWVGVVASTIAFVLAGVAHASDPIAIGREWLMGTAAEVRIYAAPTAAAAEQAVAAAFAEFRTIDRLMAVQRADSDVSRLNREAAQQVVTVDARVIEVLLASLDASRVTGGAFDVTVLPAVRAWGFLEGPPHRPTAPVRLSASGSWGIAIDATRRRVTFRDPDVGVDLGGIAKGYALDRVRTIARDVGITSAYFDLGGNVATLGLPPGEPAWRIGLRDPKHPERIVGVLAVGEASVSTSGDAERHLDDGGTRRAHIIDPRTGEPVVRAATVTIVAPSATQADALSTAAVVVGVEGTWDMVARTGVEAVVTAQDPQARVRLTVSPSLLRRRAIVTDRPLMHPPLAD